MFDYADGMAETPRGRGTGLNPTNRFEELAYEWEESADPAENPAPKTRFFRDNSRSLLVKNDSPDIPFTWSLNLSRLRARLRHATRAPQYLGLSSGLDFETKIFVKENAPALLTAELGRLGAD